MSLFERIGGLDGLQKVVKRFYKLVYVDDLVGHYFQNIDMEDMICLLYTSDAADE